jgi:hypothetical protein
VNVLNKPQLIKLLISVFLFAAILLSHMSWLDKVAEEYTEQGIKRTLITYAVARGLNGVISVAQGTELAISPAGVGLTFAPGQILDPVNDLIERFSWVVMVSGSSLGIQRLFLEITSSVVVVWLLTTFIVSYLILLWFNKNKADEKIDWEKIILSSLVVLMFVRFSVPLIAVLNEGLYVGYLQPKYETAQLQLETAADNIKLINDASRQEIKQDDEVGLLTKVELWLEKTQKNFDIEKQMDAFKQAAEDISQQIFNMIVVFVVQTIIFPLLFLWGLLKSAKGIVRRFSV